MAETLRVAFLNAELSQRGPGLLLDKVVKQTSPQVAALTEVVSAVHPDVLVLAGVDYDHDLVTLSALAESFARAGVPFPYRFARRPNTGMPTGLDLDGDGLLGGPGDAQGFGDFSGAGGMAVLSRLPIATEDARDFSGFLWADLPGNLMDGARLSAEARAVQRLASTVFWDVPVILPDGSHMNLLTYHAGPPVFDGPEDRNGRRNHDETGFWLALLSGQLAYPPPAAPFILLGDANLDPVDGDGRGDAMAMLLANPMLQDPGPQSLGGGQAALGDVNLNQRGDPALDTADWPEVNVKTGAPGPGNLRSDYILPSAGVRVVASGVHWPTADDPAQVAALAASRHRMIWVDITLP